MPVVSAPVRDPAQARAPGYLQGRGNGRSRSFPLEVVTLDAMLADFDAELSAWMDQSGIGSARARKGLEKWAMK